MEDRSKQICGDYMEAHRVTVPQGAQEREAFNLGFETGTSIAIEILMDVLEQRKAACHA
ncbi:hypothetical protein SAMN04515656_101212 [Eubacterium aggregans]|uniref:Uncharacterized protein n=1 Tax=Eubacterium aggregans TaxID=81409 RepID=A0A1H3X5K8_9FIRM|nr:MULTISPECIES: hypothetical protein [Clostridia]MEA5004309.1 hypothetical protein [Christensenella sp.]SDZ93954.1 hypothetical protein SAMN04515656_101212 [Eubacterium aggregans]